MMMKALVCAVLYHRHGTRPSRKRHLQHRPEPHVRDVREQALQYTRPLRGRFDKKDGVSDNRPRRQDRQG